MISGTDLIGYAATTLGVSMMIPQVFKIYTTRRVEDLSVLSASIYLVQSLLWGLYGLLISSHPLIIGNAIATVIAGTQLFFLFRYRQ